MCCMAVVYNEVHLSILVCDMNLLKSSVKRTHLCPRCWHYECEGKDGRTISVADSISIILLQKLKSGMGSPDWNVSMVDIHLRKFLLMYCPGHAGEKGNDWADRLAGKATLTSGLLLGRSEVLRSLIHYLRTQTKDITSSITWRREAWKEEALDDLPWKSDEHWNCFKDNFGKLLRDGLVRIWAVPSA